MTPASLQERRETIDTRFGRFALDCSDVVTMVEPLAGFETCRRYVLLSPPEIGPLVCLRGLDGDQPSFLAVAIGLIEPEFSCELSSGDFVRLGLTSWTPADAPPLWLALVRVGSDNASANLRAPVVINPARMVGLQVVPPSSEYSTEHPLPLG